MDIFDDDLYLTQPSTSADMVSIPPDVEQETSLSSLMDCASTYTSTNSLQQQPQQDNGPLNTEPLPFSSSANAPMNHATTTLMGSIPTHMSSPHVYAEPLYLPKNEEYGYQYSSSVSELGAAVATNTRTTTTMGALYQAWQQANSMSHLLDDFVQDWLPHASAEQQQQRHQLHYEAPWQDQSLRGMLDFILTDDEPSFMVPL